jgi:hypothetical protein
MCNNTWLKTSILSHTWRNTWHDFCMWQCPVWYK